MSGYEHGSEELTEGQARYYIPATEEIRSFYRGSSFSQGEQFDRWLAEVKAKEREDCVNHVKFLYCSHSMEYRPYQEAVDDIVEVLTGKEDGSDVFDKWLAEVKAEACNHTFAQQLEEHSLAELIRMAKAEGFDEGWDARVNAETITPTENPYRQGETE
jgi:hypothetical protein